MAEDENRHELVCSFADQGYQDAIQIRQLVQLLRRQNEGSINAQLNEAGAGQAAGVARNALIANLVLWFLVHMRIFVRVISTYIEPSNC
ncbi:MAG: hypothetical protein JWN71_1802 [Xanthobacteraceae bacterium]|nr:hypothetical protein [Xanthobacteraceae bacterium]